MKVSSSVKNSAIATFFQDCCTIYEKYPELAEEVFLNQKFSQVKTQTDVLIALINSERTSYGLTEVDKKRDAAFKRTQQALKGYSVLPIDEKKESALFFLAIFNRHGNSRVLTQKYIDTSALIDSIEKECTSEIAKNHLKNLDGVEALFTVLFDANKDFKALFVNKESTMAEKNVAHSATAVKKELITLCNKQILPYLDAMRMSMPEKYKDLADKIESAVKTVNASTAKRVKAVSKAEKTDKAAITEGAEEAK